MYFKHLCQVLALCKVSNARNLVLKVSGKFTKHAHFAILTHFDICCRSWQKFELVLLLCNHIFAPLLLQITKTQVLHPLSYCNFDIMLQNHPPPFSNSNPDDFKGTCHRFKFCLKCCKFVDNRFCSSFSSFFTSFFIFVGL